MPKRKSRLHLGLLAKNSLRLLPGNVVEMTLSRGKVALLDFADVPLVAAFRWHTVRSHRSGARSELFYARTIAGPNGRRAGMHEVVLGQKGVDHINHDGLDNRRSNLRPATHETNGQNQRIRSDNTSGYKGVSWRPKERQFYAYITVGRVMRCLGFFDTAEEAARVYDAAAIAAFGEYAHLNFPKRASAT